MRVRVNHLLIAIVSLTLAFTSYDRADAGFVGIADATVSTTQLGGDVLFVDGIKSQFGHTALDIPVTPVPPAFSVSSTPTVVDMGTLSVGHFGTTNDVNVGLTVTLDLVGTFSGHYTFANVAAAINSRPTHEKVWFIVPGQIFTIHGPGGAGTLTVEFAASLLDRTPNELTATFTQTQAVPEPTSMALMGLGGVGAAFGAFRRRRTAH